MVSGGGGGGGGGGRIRPSSSSSSHPPLRLLLLLFGLLCVSVSSQRSTKSTYYFLGGNDWDKMCMHGRNQSPLNFIVEKLRVIDHNSKLWKDSTITYNYKVQRNLKLTRTHTKLQIHGITSMGSISTPAGKWYPRWIDFHSPSEHTFANVHADMEMQIFHQSPTEARYMAVSILMNANPRKQVQSALLESMMWMLAPSVAGTSTTILSDVNLTSIKGVAALDFYMYNGSLTQPPCSEPVTWVVYGQPMEIAPTELTVIQSKFKQSLTFAAGRGNNRLPQPYRGRRVNWFIPAAQPTNISSYATG